MGGQTQRPCTVRRFGGAIWEEMGGKRRRTRGFIEKINMLGDRPGANDVLIHEGGGLCRRFDQLWAV